MPSRNWASFVAVVIVASLAGCSSTKIAEPTAQAPVETRSPLPTGSGSAAATSTTPAATAPAAPQSRVATVDLAKTSPVAAKPSDAAGAGAAAPGQRVVLFDYDSFVIKDEFKAAVDGHAKALAGNRGRRMVVEGHTDERGGREYNLALGQKRADAVVKAMELLGVPANQLEAVSFGKERPAATGQDESAWARNRRAELKDR